MAIKIVYFKIKSIKLIYQKIIKYLKQKINEDSKTGDWRLCVYENEMRWLGMGVSCSVLRTIKW